MGVTVSDNDDQAVAEMTAAKPKERQFQVVPVPGTFTRGRWKCWDYKDKPSETGEIIDFMDKSEKLPATVNITENAASFVGASTGNQPEAMNQSLSEPRLIGTTDSNAAISHPIDVPNPKKESSTIVVTSIAPPSVTPVHGTPLSNNISPVISGADVNYDKQRNLPVTDGGDYSASHEKLPSLPPTISAPVLSKIPETGTANNVTVMPQDVSDPNLTRQSMGTSFTSESTATNVPLNLNESEDPLVFTFYLSQCFKSISF